MYDSLARDYDRFNNWSNRLNAELPFIETQIRKASQIGAPVVLDAACGTGMHLIALSRLGFSCSGADLSAQMIRQARKNARAAGQSIDFREAAFGNLSDAFSPRRFNAVLCLGNSLPHVLTLSDLSDALVDFRQCLLPGGLLLIQSRNFNAVLAKHERWMSPEAYSNLEFEWLFQRFYDFEPNGLIRFNMVRLKRRLASAWHADVTSTLLYPQTQSVMQEALLQAGFIDVVSMGSMAGEPFDPSASGNLVLTARCPA